TGGNRPPELLVQGLADKFGGSGGAVNVEWELLCFNSLGGSEPPMTGQIVVGPDSVENVVRSPEGEHVLMGPSPQNYAIMRWARAAFTDGEHQAAGRFRAAAQAFNIAEFAGRLNGVTFPIARTVEEIPRRV